MSEQQIETPVKQELIVATLNRNFFFLKKVNGVELRTDLPDPDPTMSEADVMDFYSGRYTELTVGFVKERNLTDEGMEIEIGFTVGDKG